MRHRDNLLTRAHTKLGHENKHQLIIYLSVVGSLEYNLHTRHEAIFFCLYTNAAIEAKLEMQTSCFSDSELINLCLIHVLPLLATAFNI